MSKTSSSRRTRAAVLAVLMAAFLAATPWATAGTHDDGTPPGPKNGKGGDAHDDPGPPENATYGPDAIGAPDDGPGGKPDFVQVADKWLLKNENISIWFLQAGASGLSKPSLKVFATGEDGNNTGYRVLINRVCEVPGDASYCSGDDNHVNLEPAQEWDLAFNETDEKLTIHMALTTEQGNVTLVFHLGTDAPGLKFDLLVDDWQWSENHTGHRLGLELVMEYDGEDIAEDAEDGNITTPGGWITWATTAEATYGENDTRTLNVTHVALGPGEDAPDGNATDDGNTTAEGAMESPGRLLLLFDGEAGYGSLVYDPEFAVGDAGTSGDDGAPSDGYPSGGVSMPSPSVLAAVVGVALGGLALAYRERRR